MSDQVKWDATVETSAKVLELAQRGSMLADSLGHDIDTTNLYMSLLACHVNGCQLDLERLAAADDGNFGHDVFGIHRYLDHRTGKLTQCFLPRFAA